MQRECAELSLSIFFFHSSTFLFFPLPPWADPSLILLPPFSPTHRPHTLPPTTLYLAHLGPYLASTHTQIVSQITETQIENEALARQIDAQRTEADLLLQKLERVVADLESANGVLGECAEEVEKSGELVTMGDLGGR